MLAYLAEHTGVPACLHTREIAEKLLPAVAKLAQDGSQDARNFAKYTLVAVMDAEPAEYERILRKNLTANTMRNLEKILEALQQAGEGGKAQSSGGTAVSRIGAMRRRKKLRANGGKTM